MPLILTPQVMHVDIFSQGAWGEWIYTNGPKGFYNFEIWIYSWSTQPPLVNLLYAGTYHLFEFINIAFVNISTTIATYHLASTKFLWWFSFVKKF